MTSLTESARTLYDSVLITLQVIKEKQSLGQDPSCELASVREQLCFGGEDLVDSASKQSGVLSLNLRLLHKYYLNLLSRSEHDSKYISELTYHILELREATRQG